MTNKQVAPGIEFNGNWYSVTTPGGETWSFDPIEDEDITYIESAIQAWMQWRDFVIQKQKSSS